VNERPHFTDPWEAARVGSFMDSVEVGRWKLIHFAVDESYSRRMMAVAYAEGGPQGQLRAARTIPPGNYCCLQRRATQTELEDLDDGLVVDGDTPDGDPRYVPVMSDTPSEIREHADAIRDATGDVLITGLGLGCIVSALLAKPDVTSITVVEIDRDVIAITGPYYENEPRVKIVNMDAIAAAAWFASEGVGFDYAWHDIWSHIADRNLDDDDVAEHGISYETMFANYMPIVPEQSAWAYTEALKMREIKEDVRHRMNMWADEFVLGDYNRKLELLVYFHVVNHLPQFTIGDPVPEELFEFICAQMSVRERSAKQLEVRGGDGRRDPGHPREL
jgi:hypothetical protein